MFATKSKKKKRLLNKKSIQQYCILGREQVLRHRKDQTSEV